MNSYRRLAVKYLQLNMKRSIVTIMGVTVTVMVLYAILNLGWSALLTKREEIRKETDYEIILLTENQSQIEQILEDELIMSAYVGSYYVYSYQEQDMYNNALYVNTINPYRVLKIRSELQEKYGVKTHLNHELIATYLQSVDGSLVPALAFMVLLITFIFAIFGVGIVRNSIQLSTLEQIKDYGNMRCIGATRGQLRSIIYMEGAILEGIGNVIGIVLGYVVSVVIGYFLKWNVGFYVVPMMPIVVVFFFDLYFAMDENCKVVMNMTPVSAIRGEYRIRKEKIKVRRRNLFSLLFGVEGDYAYKNIMRNPGRFMRTVWALGIAIAAFICLVGSVGAVGYFAKQAEELFKYYQVIYESQLTPYQTVEEVNNMYLPPEEIFESIRSMDEVTEAKRIYSAQVVMADGNVFHDKYTEEYKKYTGYDEWMEQINEMVDDLKNRILLEQETIMCYGYDENDYARYAEMLVDGTLDVSENGILLVNSGYVFAEDEGMESDYDSILFEMKHITYTNYKIGDTIDIVDMKKLRELTTTEWNRLDAACEAELATLPELSEEEMYSSDTPHQKVREKYNTMKWDAYAGFRQQLMDEGSYKSYVIEGILKDDVNRTNLGLPVIIMPLTHYYALTGTDESMVTGMQYHFDRYSCKAFENALMESGEDDVDYYLSEYHDFRVIIEGFQKVNVGVGLVILFVVVMTTLNIMNTTASNLHLRRKELAQLRVIGISKNRLIKMVLLEGVISSIVASMIGITIGALLSQFAFKMIFGLLFGLEYHFSVLSAIIGVMLSTTILCGSVYAGIKDMKQDVASDLALGGD